MPEPPSADSQKPNPTTGFDPVRLIEQHQDGIWRYLRSLGCDAETAKDVTQDTFLAVLEKPFNDYNPASTAAYLRKAARNLFISAMRRAGRMIVVEDIDQIDMDWARWAGRDNGEEMLQRLQECLSLLTDRARWALEMRFRERLSRTEIADNLGITQHGAKNLMQRAKQQLRKCIQEKMN